MYERRGDETGEIGERIITGSKWLHKKKICRIQSSGLKGI